MKQKIALWGYGFLGHDLERALKECWSDRYEVTAIFDREYEKFSHDSETIHPVLDPETIEARYKAGLFDQVLISVHDQGAMKKIRNSLLTQHIPVMSLDPLTTVKPPEQCNQTDTDPVFSQEGYSVFTFVDQYVLFAPRALYPMVYDTDGSVNGAFKFGDHLSVEYFSDFFKPVHMEQALLLKGEYCMLASVFSRNYWHFIYESLDKFWLMEKNGYQGIYIVPGNQFIREFMTLVGVPAERLLFTDDLDMTALWKIEKLVRPVLNKSSDERSKAAPLLCELAEKILLTLPQSNAPYPEKLYVKRTGIRKLLGADGLLEQNGFVAMTPESFPVAEQIRYFMNAKIVFSPHGANTANALFMTPGSVLIETFPARWLNPCCISELLSRGVYYLPLFEEKDHAAGEGYSSDYSLQPEMIRSALINAEVLAESGRRR